MRIFLVAVLLLFGCDMNTSEDVIEAVNRVTGQEEPAPLPELGPPLLIEDGVRLYELLTSQETEGIRYSPCVLRQSRACAEWLLWLRHKDNYPPCIRGA